MAISYEKRKSVSKAAQSASARSKYKGEENQENARRSLLAITKKWRWRSSGAVNRNRWRSAHENEERKKESAGEERKYRKCTVWLSFHSS